MKQRPPLYLSLIIGLMLTFGSANLYALTITAVPSACDSTTGYYSLTITITYSPSEYASGPDFVLSTFYTGDPFNPVFYNGSLSGSGSDVFVATSFESNGFQGVDMNFQGVDMFGSPNSSIDFPDVYNAPAACYVPCSLDIISATPSACNPATNTHSVELQLSYASIGTNNKFVISDTTGFSEIVTITTSPQTVTLTNQTSNGLQNRKITAQMLFTPTCKNSTTYNVPVSCAIAPPSCSLDITSAIPSACDTTNNKYSVALQLTYANVGTNTDIVFSNSTGPIDTVSITTSPQTVTLTNLTSDGLSHLLYARMLSDTTCKDTITYKAPASCVCPANEYMLCKDESYTITAQTGLKTVQWQKLVNGIWTDISGANIAAYIANTVGSYRYIGTDANDCAITMCCPYVLTSAGCPTCPFPNCATATISKITP